VGKNDFSWNYSLTCVASSFLVGVDDKSIVKNRMEIYGATLAWNFQKAGCVRMTTLPSAFLEALRVASVITLPEAFVKTLTIPSASCVFKVI
jgi:hypothetical protein